jgi:hypothetical protein
MLRNTFMHCRAGILFVAAIGLASAYGAEPIPSALPADRYSAMGANCPFATATPTVAAPQPQASFAANWFISGIARIGDSDFVTVKARDLSTQFSLFGNEPNSENGVILASVNWSETIGKSTVVLRRGTETAKLEFNEAQIHSAPQAAPEPGKPGAPKPANVGGVPPGTPPQMPGAPTPNATGVVPPNSPPLRRRVLPIPSPR